VKTIQIYESEYLELRRRIRELEDQRRERIATAALQGLVAHRGYHYGHLHSEGPEERKWLAEVSVDQADALIEALDAKTEPK
jgi:hypothetical protein